MPADETSDPEADAVAGENAAVDDPGEAAATAPGGGDDGVPGEVQTNDGDSNYKHAVAIILALLGVLAGWIAILATNAATNESRFARETTRRAIEAQTAALGEQAVLALRGRRYERARLPRGAAVLRGEPGRGARRARRCPGVSQEERLAEAEAVFEDTIGSADDGDVSLELAARQLSLEQASLTDQRVTWNARASQYETVLTVVAVAIFLIGFTLVLDRRARPPILLPGLILAGYCLGWSIHIYNKPIPTTSEAAIESTAVGTVLLDKGDTGEAIAAFSAAIAAESDFVEPYEGRALARFVDANPDFFETFAISDNDPELLEAAAVDISEAIELGGGDDATVLAVAAVLAYAANDYETTAAFLEQIVEVNDQTPDVQLLLGAVEIARGDEAEARRWLERATGLLSATEPSNRNRQLAAQTYSAFEWVAHSLPDRAETARALRDDLVRVESRFVAGRELGGVVPPAAGLVVHDVTVATGSVTFDLELVGLDEDDIVTLLAYEQPTVDGPWVQAPTLSYIGPAFESDREPNPIEITRACRPVAFRIDLYVDGAFVSSTHQPGVTATC